MANVPAIKEYELLKDSKYRVYVTAVDKALKSFEYTSEWADLIAALGKLNKVLSSHKQFPVIPRRIKLSKRLAQCTHPALPAGVHLKALETYDIIFTCMGSARLAQELFIYSAGIFPLLAHAATPVKPALLTLYERHFVPLGEHLKPALPGLLNGVLPGLETGSDYYESTNSLLEKVCTAVGPENFFAALWRCIQSDSPARAPAVAYALAYVNNLNKRALTSRTGVTDIPMDHISGDNAELMLMALESAVQDSSVLVQRSVLDLLLLASPTHGRQPPTSSLVSAALFTFLRRDMSLNRRVYSWLFGSEVNLNLLPKSHEIIQNMRGEDSKIITTRYYKKYSHHLLIGAIRLILADCCRADKQNDLKAYRLLTTLLEKPEIAQEILDSILYEVFRALYLTCQKQLNDTSLMCDKKRRKKALTDVCADLIKKVNSLFESLETSYIWNYIGDLIVKGAGFNESYTRVQDVGSGEPKILEICHLADFLVDVIPIETYKENCCDVLPNLFVRIINFTNTSLSRLTANELTEILNLCKTILTKVQPITTSVTAVNNDVVDVMAGDVQINDTGNDAADTMVTSHGVKFDKMEERSKSTIDLRNNETLKKFQQNGTINFDLDHQRTTKAMKMKKYDLESASDNTSLKASPVLEKSKSDSKLNENSLVNGPSNTNQLTVTNDERERSNSNQMMKLFPLRSPKGDKKTAKPGGAVVEKKSKSNSKLFEAKDKTDNLIIVGSKPSMPPHITEIMKATISNETEDVVPTVIYTQKMDVANGDDAIKMKANVENKLIVECLDCYKNFFVNLLQNKVYSNVLLIDYYNKMVGLKDQDQQSTNDLRDLLSFCLDNKCKKPMTHSRTSYDRLNLKGNGDVDVVELKSQFYIRNMNLHQYADTVRAATNMLIEFSIFSNILDQNDALEGDIPVWLKYLTAICCIECDSRSVDIQLTSMWTFLVIASLAKSLKKLTKNVTDGNSVVLVGILKNEYVTFIEHHTFIVELMSQCLWDILDRVNAQSQIISTVSLLYQTHNVFSDHDFVESVIGRYLVNGTCNLETFRKFALMWHVGRDLKLKGFEQTMKHFDKCLLKILDNLENIENMPLKLTTDNFIMHCLLRNDVSRLINPIFYMLLSAQTARVSVLHVNIEKSNRNVSASTNTPYSCAFDATLKNVYAISSVDGHVMHHVADNPFMKKKESKRRLFPFKKSTTNSNEAVNLATSLVDDKNVVTKPNMKFRVDHDVKNGARPFRLKPLNGAKITSNVKVIVNPLSYKDDSDKSSSDDTSSSSDSISEEPESLGTGASDKSIIFPNDSNSLMEDFELSNDIPDEIKATRAHALKQDAQSRASSPGDSSLNLFSPSKVMERIEPISDGVSSDYVVSSQKLTKSHSFDEKDNYIEITTDRDDPNTAEVTFHNSWSHNVHKSDLEMSTTAEEFFSNGESVSTANAPIDVEAMVRDIIYDILDQSCNVRNEKKPEKKRSILKNGDFSQVGNISIGTSHSHLLLYRDVYDSNMVLYALRTLKQVVVSNTKMLINSLTTTSLQSPSVILNLLAQHRKSVYGFGFYGGDYTDYKNHFQGNMYLEILISICLNYARSFYPNLTTKRLTETELSNNLRIQLECLEILNIIIKELVSIVREGSKGFACYIADMLLKCKLQKVLLHSLVASVKSCCHSNDYYTSAGDNKRTFTDEILLFNGFVFKTGDGKVSEFIEAFQIQLLRLVQSLIALEYYVGVRSESPLIAPIPQQSTFQAGVLAALESNALRSLHRSWAGTVAASLPYLGTSLTQIVLSVIHQLCSNIEKIAKFYAANDLTNLELVDHLQEAHKKTFKIDSIYKVKNLSMEFNLTPVDTMDDVFFSADYPATQAKQTPRNNTTRAFSSSSSSKKHSFNSDMCIDLLPDYAINEMESLIILVHYCLLENSYVNVLMQQNPSQTSQMNGSQATSFVTLPTAILPNPGQIINNILSAFLPNPLSIEDAHTKSSQDAEFYLKARNAVLSHLPRIVTSVALLWQYVSAPRNVADDDGDLGGAEHSVFGCYSTLRKQLLEFLSPISLHHTAHFVAAVGVAWNERRSSDNPSKTVIARPNAAQLSLVNLVADIRVIPVDMLIQTIHSVIKTPPVTESVKSDINMDVSILELLYCYMQSMTNVELLGSWNSILNLLKDGPTFTPPSQFIVLALLNEIVQKCSPLSEKKDQKDLQDVTTKMVESLSQISGSCLEQTTWLRRNLAVKEGDISLSSSLSSLEYPSMHNCNVQSQLILAEIVAPLLDVCFGQDKDKVISIVSSMMNNVVPYLRKHTIRNAASWTACSSLLAKLSGYSATRRAWRREAFDIFLDPAFFKMPQECLKYWRDIVDNLMTHDNTTFRELMNRVSMGQSSGLSLFSSREQEYEQRSMLLRRLAFVIICGDIDQYSKYMPEIQEQLVGGLRIGAPNVAAAVFLNCRALLLRVTPAHITSLWPLILSECLQALNRVELQLKSRFTPNVDQISASVLDASWASCDCFSPEGLKLTISAVQLIDLALVMPPHILSHFQMYRWAFVEENFKKDETKNASDNDENQFFIPHINRIETLMDQSSGPCEVLHPHKSGLFLIGRAAAETPVKFSDLHALFKAVASRGYLEQSKVEVADLIAAIELDFLEKMPA